MTTSQTVRVGSKVGLHARPAATVVKAAAGLPAIVKIAKGDGNPVDARSLLSILSLGAGPDDEVTLTSEGDGAEESVKTLAELIASDLDA